MDKLKMHTLNKADENPKKLAEMFPDTVATNFEQIFATYSPVTERKVL